MAVSRVVIANSGANPSEGKTMIGKTFNRWAMLYALFCLSFTRSSVSKAYGKRALNRRCADGK